MKRVAYLGFKGLAWIILAIVLLQFFFAGIVVFGEETWGDSAVLPHRIAGWLVILARSRAADPGLRSPSLPGARGARR